MKDNFVLIIIAAIGIVALAGFTSYFIAPPLQPFKSWINPNTLMDNCEKKGTYHVDKSKVISCSVK